MPTLDETKEFIDFAKKVEEVFKKELGSQKNGREKNQKFSPIVSLLCQIQNLSGIRLFKL